MHPFSANQKTPKIKLHLEYRLKKRNKELKNINANEHV
jgi:hypothetical protein